MVYNIDLFHYTTRIVQNGLPPYCKASWFILFGSALYVERTISINRKQEKKMYA